jgi:OOP family OmpA-OmpF porin
MTKKPVGWVALCVLVAAATPARAQDAEGKFEPYVAGYPPEHNLLELGVFGGVLLPADDQNLVDERFPQRSFRTAPELGGRLGWYPLSFLGLEVEGAGMPSKSEDGSSGGLFALTFFWVRRRV